MDYGYRDYRSLTGRFNTADPIGDGANWYAYVYNDPVNFIDPLGLCGEKAENYWMIPNFTKYEYSGTPLDVVTFVDNVFIGTGNNIVGFLNTPVQSVQYIAHNGPEVWMEANINGLKMTCQAIGEGVAGGWNYYWANSIDRQVGDFLNWISKVENGEAAGTFVVEAFLLGRVTKHIAGKYAPTNKPLLGRVFGVVEEVESVVDDVLGVGDDAAGMGPTSGKTTVYQSLNVGGEAQYVGITDDFASRAAVHLRTKGISIKPIAGLQNISRYQARAIEQVLIEYHGLGKNMGSLLNKINSIATKNPIYANSLTKGIKFLKYVEYPGF